MDSKEVNTWLNAAGAQPICLTHGDCAELEQARDGSSAMFDFVITYSIHQMVDPRSEMLQNRDTSKQPSLDEDPPFTKAATAAWLSTHNTQVRGFVVGQASAIQAIRTAAHNSKINIGDSVASS